MPDIIFAKTTHTYDSYTDLYRLAELAGFPIIDMGDLDVSEPGIYITAPMNGDTREHLRSQAHKPRLAHIIWWNIERPAAVGGGGGSVGKYALDCRYAMYGQEPDGSPAPCRYVDEVWVSDRRLAQETELRYVVLGSNDGLGRPGSIKTYDFVHMSALVPRRQTIIKHFPEEKVAPNCWPWDENPNRTQVLRLSRLAINVHQDTMPFGEPLRFALFAAYGLPILSETLVDAYPYGAETMAFAPYDLIVESAFKIVSSDNWDRWRAMGERCRQLMTKEFEFGKVVRQAVHQSVGDWR